MIGIRLVNHDYYNEAADIIRMYFGKCEIVRSERALADSQSSLQDNNIFIISRLEIAGKSAVCTSIYQELNKQEKAVEESSTEIADDKALKQLVKKSMYKLLAGVFNREYPWGILTGIRPVKIVHELMNNMIPPANIQERLVGEYLVSRDRAELALKIAGIERPFIYPYNNKVISIYIGIPFCPSRCHYCSFTSNSISAYGRYVKPYLENLMEEIRRVSEFLNNNGFRVQTIYMGGGTPTALSALQLERLIKCIGQSFGRQEEEFTCEAGRPDSITEEKLQVLYENKISRISINPQTMNDSTLKSIGRAHDAEQVAESFRLARSVGFNNINMDIILGLPGETLAELVHTLEEINKLDPESVTVHTLALKRASALNEKHMKGALLDDENVSRMMKYAKKFLGDMGMYPYYLYRQKHMVQNLENIGFSKKGFECIYNMQIIEERQTIAAFGADAVTKVVINRENRIERQHNIKDIKLYIENIDAMIKKKLDVLKQIPLEE
ncbi:MAG: coproporphyrinogen dehydrogenase HemZ [Gracilibacteraceae bacterium]|jgi:coproporphyrinogen dehydrogenase HemZ|nr:coproporphyrinogen dehydrogenase HemZ [Gracilibacteraceae bacterium]